MFTKVHPLVRKFFPSRLWKMPGTEKDLYLTFDDGPIPEVTPWVLEQLKKFDAKATFFCIGDNIRKHPEIFKQLIADGHIIGNHTFNHLNGWKTSAKEYLENVLLAEEAISEISEERKEEKEDYQPLRQNVPTLRHSTRSVHLFRPPYGRISGKQAKILRKQHFKIVMWDVLSRDYDQSLSAEKCYQKVVKNTEAGSIIVFHDSLKAEGNMKAVLPKVLEYYSRKGFSFKRLEP